MKNGRWSGQLAGIVGPSESMPLGVEPPVDSNGEVISRDHYFKLRVLQFLSNGHNPEGYIAAIDALGSNGGVDGWNARGALIDYFPEVFDANGTDPVRNISSDKGAIQVAENVYKICKEKLSEED